MPDDVNLFIGGGRGGGKSILALLMLIKHAEQAGVRCKALYVRETYDSLVQIEQDFEMLLAQIYGDKVSHNKTEGLFTFPNGAQVTFGQIAESKHYIKFQGRSFTQIICDEYGTVRQPRWINMLFSNIRGSKDVAKRIVLIANPGGAQHGNLYHNYVLKAPPWTPYEKDGEWWVNCPSTWRDNPNIDAEAYIKKLRTSCGNDEALLKAWDTGDWNISRGAFFAGILDEKIHMLSDAQTPIGKLPRSWLPYMAMDWGSGAPSVTYILGESPGVPGYPKGSLIAFDELATCDPHDRTVGLGWAPDKLAEAMKELADPWGCPYEGVGDEAYGLQETLLETLAESGVYFIRPRKERVAGWELMRNMLANAKEQNGKPGLWIARRCRYFWETAPHIQRDEKRLDDLDSNGEDHGCDALRYGVLHRGHGAFSSGVVGNY